MICARDVKHHRAANAILFRYTDRRLDFCQLARDYDLVYCINVGNVDIFICGKPAHVVFQPADHRRHASKRCCARFIHKFGALLDKLQACSKIECTSGCVRSYFPKRQTSRTSDGKIACDLTQHCQRGERMNIKRGLTIARPR